MLSVFAVRTATDLPCGAIFAFCDGIVASVRPTTTEDQQCKNQRTFTRDADRASYSYIAPKTWKSQRKQLLCARTPPSDFGSNMPGLYRWPHTKVFTVKATVAGGIFEVNHQPSIFRGRPCVTRIALPSKPHLLRRFAQSACTRCST